MPSPDLNLTGRGGGAGVRSYSGYDPRIISFYFLGALLLAVLAAGLAYRQILETDVYHQRERQQNQRRVLVPGPRGNIYDRAGHALVENRPRFAVVLFLDELQGEFVHEARVIRKAYLEAGDRDLPTRSQFEQIARSSVVQRYLDQINAILDRTEKVNVPGLRKHFETQLLLPYLLLDDLSAEEYAQLIERLPVRSPLQVYTSSTRYYPYGPAAAHTLGMVGTGADLDDNDFPGEDLTTLKMKGTVGRDGLERRFDSRLQGEPGGTIFRVDPAGYKVNPPLEKRLPVQGRNLVTSLDIDLQQAAETAIGDQTGAAVVLDVATGEVLVLASKPDYDLNNTSPHITPEAWQDILSRGALLNRATAGTYPPGSTFKLMVSIAGLRSGRLDPDALISNCEGTLRVGNRVFHCDNGNGHHGEIALPAAIATSCDVYFWTAGLMISPQVIAAEARRFHLDQRTGIELPAETGRMVIPDPDWKRQSVNEPWVPGDTANMAIGQGFVAVSPLGMACMVASIARNEVWTRPTLLHTPGAARQHTESIGLTPGQRAALLAGMVECANSKSAPRGTAAPYLTLPAYRIPGVTIAGKTGTAQKRVLKDGKLGTINYAWFVCFAPAENPEVAAAVMLEGDTLGEEFGGGANAGPVAATILRKYFEKQAHPVPGLIPNRPGT